MTKKGKVYIIGAGPGDPELITLRGVECIAGADVIIYDYLVAPEILSHAGDDARLVYAGKHGGNHTLSQGQINDLLVAEAKKGAVVARVKGGDPFIFGRGGEEAEVLQKHGIPFEVVPGISSAVAVPAYAGIPLTHRNHTVSVAFVTGHEDPTKGKSDLRWSTLAGIGTLVFLMGVKNLPVITENLIAAGREPSTPAALIRWGTTSRQQTLMGTLGDIVRKAKEQGFTPPSVFVIGSVVNLRKTMNWFETKPLFGRGMVLTGSERQTRELAKGLRARGAMVINFPVTQTVPPEDCSRLDRAMDSLGSYHWIIFTSVDGVTFFFRRMRELGKDIRGLKGVKIAAATLETTAAIGARGMNVDLAYEDFPAEGAISPFAGHDWEGCRILVPCAQGDTDVISRWLYNKGAIIDEVAAYQRICTDRDPSEMIRLFDNGEIEMVTFFDPADILDFLKITGERLQNLPRLRVVAIGSRTAEAAKRAGLTVPISRERCTVPELVEAITASF